MDQVLATFEKNGREEVRVILSEFKAQMVINIRAFVLASGGERLPTPKGSPSKPRSCAP